ncbi:YadA family autotransporter adhesin, partial [Dyella tabacisoli]
TGDITNLGDTVTNITNNITNGTIGLVQQDAVNKTITIGKDVTGTVINVAGTDGTQVINRKLTGVAAGTLADDSTDAVNGAQLKTTNDNVTKVEGDVTNLGDTVNNITNNITNGTMGLVQQDATSKNITIGKDVGGTVINVAGTDGTQVINRKLTGVAAGTLADDSTDAVNGAQLKTTNDNVTKVEGDVTTINNALTSSTRYLKVNGLPGEGHGDVDASASGGNAIAVGPGAVASDSNTVAVGHQANATGVNSIALGLQTKSIGVESVALGSYSVSDRDFTVSVGNAGMERQIVHVKAGTERSDAVNVGQLTPVVDALGGGAKIDAVTGAVTGPTYTVQNGTQTTVGGALDALDTGVKKNTDDITSITHNITNGTVGLVQQDAANKTITIGKDVGGTVINVAGTDGTQAVDRQVTGVADGVNANDAVNVGQLSNAQSAVTTAITNNVKTAFGDTLNYFKADGANDGSDDATVAKGSKGVAMGAGAEVTADADNAVALGAGSVADKANTVSVGAIGKERRITNVADGVDDTDAANMSQLKKTGIIDPDGTVREAVTYDTGSSRGVVTLGGGAAGTLMTNLRDGAIATGSRDAVNGGQIAAIRDDLQNKITNVDNRVINIENNGSGLGKGTAGVAVDGADGVAGKPAVVTTGSEGTAAGMNAQATGTGSTAVGANSVASGANSTAIGAGSVADRADTVSVGSLTSQRQITNVAAGTAPTDAVNMSQFNAGVTEAKDWAKSYTDKRFDSVSRDINRIGQRANAGVASAMAMASLPQAYEPGRNMMGASVGMFRGETSLAVGLSAISESGRWVYKFNASSNTRGDLGAGMGVGMMW